MTTVSVLTLLSVQDEQLWLLGTIMTLRLATAGISFAVAVHRGVRYFRKEAR